MKEITVKDLAIGILSLKGETLSQEKINKERMNINKKIRDNALPFRQDLNRKVGYWISLETALEILKLAKKSSNRSIMNISGEELLEAITRGKENLQEEKERSRLERKDTTYTLWYLNLKELIEPLMREGRSIQKPIQDYYHSLVPKLYEISAIPTALSILVKHRKYLTGEAIQTVEKNGWKKSLITQSSSEREWSSYEKDLEEARWLFRDPDSMKKATRTRQNKSLEDRHGNLAKLPYTLNEFQRKLDTLFRSYDLRDHLLGAMLATGRRWEEIEEKGDFRLPTEEEVKSSDFPDLTVDTAFFIKGLAKKQEENVEGVFPCLYNPERVVLAIGFLRKIGMSKASFIKFMLKEHSEIGRKLHDTRRFYARFSYRLFCKSKSYSPILWVKRAMGHQSDNWISLLSYMTHMDKEE